MPTVTVSGGTYSALVQYTTNDAFSYAAAVGEADQHRTEAAGR